MQLFLATLQSETKAFLSGQEARHCSKVLRHQAGDEIWLTALDGYYRRGRIAQTGRDEVEVALLESRPAPALPYQLELVVAPLKKPDRFEFLLEKVTELGLSQISVVPTRRTEKPYKNTQRLEKTLASACKQSLKARKPRLGFYQGLGDYLAQKPEGPCWLAHAGTGETPSLAAALHQTIASRHTLWIGPEGDFAPEELEQIFHSGFQAVHLGSSRLRSETAAIAGTSLVYWHHAKDHPPYSLPFL